MLSGNAEGDAAADLLERRWFASMAAARAKQAECEALREVMTTAKASWSDSRAELLRIEALRDALADAVAGLAAERTALCLRFAPEPVREGSLGKAQRDMAAGKSQNVSRTRRAAST
jgi:hypothetical protein